MNAYKNLLEKVKALLKIDDNLTTKQAETHQWQLLIKISDYTFFVGKGGVTTMFFSNSSDSRATCYPEEMLDILKELAESKVFVYEAFDRKKNSLGYSHNQDIAKEFDNAHTIKAINFRGAKKTVAKKGKDIYGKAVWQKIQRVRSRSRS